MTAETIKQLREARGWTQAELARRLNISRNGVNTWEQGLSMPSPHFLVELAKIGLSCTCVSLRGIPLRKRQK